MNAKPSKISIKQSNASKATKKVIPSPQGSRPAKVLTCTCSHNSQDYIYGKQKRTMNPCLQGASASGYRCTVCGVVSSEQKKEQVK